MSTINEFTSLHHASGQCECDTPDLGLNPGLTAGAQPVPPDVSSLEPLGDPEPRPHILLTMKRLPEAAARATAALAAYNFQPVIFRHSDNLVRIADVGCIAGQLLTAVSLADLRCDLAYAARWYEQTDRGVKPIYPPPMIVHDVMRRAAEWAPPLRDVVRIPVFGTDWHLLSEPGYHAHDQIYYRPDHAPLPTLGEVPTDADVAAARTLICDDLLGQFPFAANAHRAAAVAALLVPFVRQRIDGATPLHLFDSPQPGTGKTLLADAVSIPALGREPAANTEIASGDDLRKWVTAMALAREGVVLIDNVNARLKGSALAAALTKVEWSDRVIGTSRLARGNVRCLWLATGNNVTMASELARRVVRCRLDAGVQHPFLRAGFRHADLRGWAKAERHRLIWAALTMVQHWVAVGRPEGAVVLGSYESYCRVIGGILAAAGIEGFLSDVQAEQGRCDEETLEWAAFVAAWGEQFGEARVRAEELDKEVLAPNSEMLSVTLLGANSQRGRRIKLGQELRKRRDAVIGGWRLRVSDEVDRHGCWHYHLRSVPAA